MEFPGQGSDLSCSCDLSRSCGNARSLTHCASPGIEPVSQCSPDAADLTELQLELRSQSFYQVTKGMELPLLEIGKRGVGDRGKLKKSFFFFWLCLCHVEVPRPGTEPESQ